LYISIIASIVFAMITKLAEEEMKAKLIIAVGIAAIIITGIESHTAFAIKVSKTSFQDGYNAGFAEGRKDRINDNEFDSKPPKGHSDAYDEGYRRGYEDGWFRGEHFSSNSAAAASSSSSAAAGDDDDHKRKDSAAASSSSSATAGGGGGHHHDSAAASSSSSAAARGGSAAASSSSSASS
jgi:hypothetical protein